MAQHGYLREWDEAWDRGNDDDRDRERSWRGDRDRDDRNFMFRDRDHDRDRGFFDRMGDRARESFGSDDRQWRGSHQDEWSNRDRSFGSGSSRGQQRSGGGSDWDRSPRGFRSHQDDHYVSWRNRQLEALDRDYDDYCREREQQFHSDFDNWRRNRGQNRGQQQQQSPRSQTSEEVMELDNPSTEAPEFNRGPSPVADATLGTNNSENTGIGRR